MDIFHVSNLLFTPGNKPDRFDKGLRCGTDGVILDLEDAVAPSDKDIARAQVFQWLARQQAHTQVNRPLRAVRLNAMDSAFFDADQAALMQTLGAGHGPDLVVLPKVESAPALAAMVARWAGSVASVPGVIALIESARGLHHAAQIAGACPQIVALGFGGADMATDLGCAFAWEPLLYARSHLVQAAALARIAVLDVPCLAVRDPNGLAQETRRAKDLGFTGKLAIHPDQVSIIAQAMQPDDHAVRIAQSIVEAAQSNPQGVCVVDGRMVDEPVVAGARRLLERHRSSLSRLASQGI